MSVCINQLRISIAEDVSLMSDDLSSLQSPEETAPTIMNDWPRPATSMSSHDLDPVSKGPQKSETQLRYLLQMLLEANCLELAAVVSIVLKDALALIRIVNAARAPSSRTEVSANKSVVRRLYRSLKSLESWATNECQGYVSFFNAIQPQLNSLRSFLNLEVESREGSTSPVGNASSASLTQPMGLPPSGRKLSPTAPLLHRSSTSSLRSNPQFRKLTVSKQHSLPSDVTMTEVGNAKKKTSLSVQPEETAKEVENDGDADSVISDVLPEGQDEQAGCFLM